MLRASRFRASKSIFQRPSTRRPISRQPVRARPFLQVLEDRTLPTADLTLFSPDAIAGDRFGGAVVVRDDEIVAGAPRADVNGVSKAGAVYIFDSVSGDLLRTIENPNPTKGDKFGKSVALLDDFIIVGSPGAKHNGQAGAGVVYIFDGDTGELLQTLRQPGKPNQLGFGSSIVVQDELIIISAPQDDSGGMVTRGAVYVFDGDTGQLLRTINSPTADLGARDRFGRSMAAFETQIIVGAPRTTINGVVHTGAVHVFDLNTGQLVRTIANPEPGLGDRFGRAVAVLDDVILVGTPRGGANGADEIGVVHFFDAATGQLLNTLANPGAGKADRFGRVVMVEDGMIFISAPLTDHEGEVNAGLAYQFDADQTLTKTWVSPTPVSGELYGLSMAVFGSTTVVGAKSRSTAPLDSGMLYVYLDVGVIAGFKFNDLNGNGVRDEGEPGLAGFTFFLDANNNGIQDAGELTAVSGEDGTFRFEGVKAGTYRVREVAQAGWVQTTTNPGPITLGGGQAINGGTFGNFRQITISGVKFDDRNGNGVRDFTEEGLEGWTIFIDANDNGELDEGEVFTTTGADGSYAFTNLGPGQYLIREVSQEGWVRTSANPEIISAVSGSDVTDVNFGNFQTMSISGQKFHDLNGNAEKDEGEPGLEGWTIFIDANDNGQLDEGELFAVTDADGNYTITGVGPGLHRVREVVQAGWAQTSPVPADLTALSGTNITDIDFGNFQLATISGLKYEDLNGNGVFDEGEPVLAGWTIFLDDNLNGILDETEPFAITGEDGTYTITGVGNGPHFVREIPQVGWVQSSANPGIIVPMSGQIITGIDFGNFRTVSISGVKFDDRNNNGERDEDEPGLEGWTIYIDANDNGQLDEGELFAVTSADGRYVITGAGPGPLRVREVAQPGWQQTTPNPADLFPTSGVNVTGIDFGNFQLARIGGVKFNDLNGNGERDEGEDGLAGWTIFVDLNDNGELDEGEPFAVTGVDGSYLIVGLEPGTYLVREVLQAGWIQTTANPDPITLSAGELVEGIDFGNFQLARIGGVKFHDLNGNGERDEGEDGLAGWTIFVDLNDNGELDEGEPFAVTGVDGSYLIVGLEPGTYLVREVLPAGWIQTTANPDPITLSAGELVEGIDFGNFQLATISGMKFEDLDGNGLLDEGELGLEGWTIYIDANDNGELDEGELFAVTDADGNFTIENVGPGAHQLREVLPSGWLQTTDDPAPVNVSSGSSVSGIVFGNFQLISVSGQKFEDVNGNGELDEGELGLEGRTIFVDANSNGELDEGELFAVTDADGNFTISGIGPGLHLIREVVPEGWRQTTTNPPAVLASSGQNVADVLFGNFKDIAISGRKFNDLNGNGELDDGEEGLEGWTIFLDANDNGELDEGEQFVVTDAEGNYTFTGVGPGTHLVREVLQEGWEATTPLPDPIVAVSGQDVLDILFGNREAV